MLHITVPGKLMLAGEWGVLEEGNSCIVMAINKYVTANIKKSDKMIISSQEIGLEKAEVTFNENEINLLVARNKKEQEQFLLTKYALETTLLYLKEQRISLTNFALTLNSEGSHIRLHDGSSVKVGFGSSAAVAVAITKAILAQHKQTFTTDATKHLLFKLACIAHYKAQKERGSGFDVAASAYATTLYYKRFNAHWLSEKLKKNKTISSIVNQEWPGLEIVPLPLPPQFTLCVGFVGFSATTKELITQMQEFKKAYPVRYKHLCSLINTTVHDLAQALKKNNREKILELIRHNKQVLKHLSQESGANLETKEFSAFIESAERCGAASKFSGAGGGDCGIAVCFDKYVAQKIHRRWEKAGFYPINTHHIS